MSYGLSVINDSSYLQIDSDNPRLCALYKGTYTSGSNTAVITFPAAITTAEPPCIFLQNSSARNDDLYDQMYMTGSAGNWTGFVLRANNINMRPTGKWFAAVFASLATGNQYGLRIWNESGTILFDSGATPIIFTKANHNWTYQGVVQFPSLGAAYFYANSLVAPLASDEYFMMNPYSRGVVGTQPNFFPRGVRFNYSTNRLEMYIVASGAGPWTDQGQPGAIYARLPGS